MSRDAEVEDFRSQIGRTVLYVPYHAHGDLRHSSVERGVVTSLNKMFVFVRFDGEPKACSPQDLRYIPDSEQPPARVQS